MTVSLADGFRARAATDADISVAAGIIRAEEEMLRGESIWGVEDIQDFWRVANLKDGGWIVETDDGTPAAFAVMLERDADPSCWSWVCVHPKFSGRGLATALLQKVEQRARLTGSLNLRIGAFSENDAATQLFKTLGFREARHYYQMRIDLSEPPPPPQWPAGIAPSPFRLEDAREFHHTLDDAFAEEWGFVSMPYEEWKAARVDAPGTDFSLWFVARETNQIVGAARCDPKQSGGGWISALGVRKPWRQRGLGLALLSHAFVEFHRRGEPHVGLGVDAENPTGATRLYERAGMRIIKEDVVFEKELS
jgi:mycothiol synthase